MSKPAWLMMAYKYIGTKEIPGNGNNSLIVKMFAWIKRSGIKKDAVPWCAAFVGACLEQCGIVSTRFEGALSYLNWGQALPGPCVGAIAVFTRKGGGHVGFVVGKDEYGNIIVLGGNQSDRVCEKAFPPTRATAYRWPKALPIPSEMQLPVLALIPLSTREA